MEGNRREGSTRLNKGDTNVFNRGLTYMSVSSNRFIGALLNKNNKAW